MPETPAQRVSPTPPMIRVLDALAGGGSLASGWTLDKCGRKWVDGMLDLKREQIEKIPVSVVVAMEAKGLIVADGDFFAVADGGPA